MAKNKDAKAIKAFGSPEKLVNQYVKGADQRAWALELLIEHGPPHKQLQHTLVLNRLERLSRLLSKRHGPVQTKREEGIEVNIAGGEESWPLAVNLPGRSLGRVAKEKSIMEALTAGPEHEIFYTALMLQVIESMISAEEAKQL